MHRVTLDPNVLLRGASGHTVEEQKHVGKL
jgi:hypothetical protein